MRVHIADHPLIAHKLTALRDKHTDSPTFRRLADELVTLLAYEATRDVRVEPVDIDTLAAAIRYLVDLGADDITAICLLAAPEGIQRLEEQISDLSVPVTIVSGAVDERLNELGYIVPGLGDAGDRLYGVV